MKKTTSRATIFFKSIGIYAATGRMSRAIVTTRENFCCIIFTLPESQDQNLEIVYANIRV